MKARAPKLCVGVGNVLRRDDGVGVRAAEILAGMPLPPQVEVYEAGTAALGLTSVIEGREKVVGIDAMHAGARPGAVFRLTPAHLRACFHAGLSLHEVHFLDALEETLLLGTPPREVVILAVQVGDVSTGIGLSPAVERAVDRVVELALHELGLPNTAGGACATCGELCLGRRTPWK